MIPVENWHGAVGGVAVGLYAVIQFWLTGHKLGASTGYGNLCYLGGSRLRYFRTGAHEKVNNHRLWMIVGLPLGGLIAFITSGTNDITAWQAHFNMDAYEAVLPGNLALRIPILLLGGVAIGYGGRLAGGCQSGHSITGMGLLNPPSFAASVGFFVGGIVIVQILFRGFAV